jgi:hypothetical protein
VGTRIAVVLGVFVAALAVTATTNAATLRFSVPSDCDPRTDVIEDVERLIGRSLDEVDAEFDVSITTRKNGGYELLISNPRSGKDAARRLTGETCAEIGNAASVTLAIAMRLDAAPKAEPEATPLTTPAARTRPAELQPVRDAAPRPRPPSAASEVPFALLGLSAVVDTGALPAVVAGGELSAGVGWRSVRFLALGTFLAPASASLTEGRGGEFRLFAASPLVCFERARSVSVRGCLGFELGRLSGEGTGVAASRLGSALWAAPRGELGVTFALGDGLAGVAGVGVLMPLSRPPFVLDAGEQVHRSAAFDLRGRLGVEFRP